MLLHQQVIARCNVTVFVALDLLSCVLRIDVVLRQHAQYLLINLDFGVTHIQATFLIIGCTFAMCFIPLMTTNAINSQSTIWVSVQNCMQHVFGHLVHEIRHFELTTEDLLIQLRCVRVLKRKVATDHSV